jgi:hypothetical protein
MSKKEMSILLTLLFTGRAFFGLGEFGLFRSITHVRFMLSSPKACLINATAFIALFWDICTQFVSHSLSDPSRNRVGQTHDSKYKDVKYRHVHPSA